MIKTNILKIDLIMEKDEIQKFNKIIPKNTNLEINVFDPNTEKHMINEGIQVFLNNKRKHADVFLNCLL